MFLLLARAEADYRCQNCKDSFHNDVELQFIDARDISIVTYKSRFIGVNIHLFSRMLLDRRNNLAPQLIIFRKCSMIHRFNCSITSDDVHAEVLTIPLLCKVSKTIYGSNYVKEKMYLSVL